MHEITLNKINETKSNNLERTFEMMDHDKDIGQLDIDQFKRLFYRVILINLLLIHGPAGGFL